MFNRSVLVRTSDLKELERILEFVRPFLPEGLYYDKNIDVAVTFKANYTKFGIAWTTVYSVRLEKKWLRDFADDDLIRAIKDGDV